MIDYIEALAFFVGVLGGIASVFIAFVFLAMRVMS